MCMSRYNAMQIGHIVEFIDEQAYFVMVRYHGHIRVFLIYKTKGAYTCYGQAQIWERLSVTERDALLLFVAQARSGTPVYRIQGKNVLQEWLGNHFYPFADSLYGNSSI